MNPKLLQKIFAVCLGLICLSAVTAYAQTTVRGRVVSAEDQQPLIGLQVVIKGTTTGVLTNNDGYYTISVTGPDDVLVFSYLGFATREIPVGVQTSINVSMESDRLLLDDVIVMGYSSVRKAELTSSLVTLSGDQLNDISSPDIGTLLQGKASGVMITNESGQPGSSATIRIRGTGSITASSDPLFVVDGIPGGTFDPNDVETITVLKDIGATAIYGANGAGGVIVVTTKSAKRNQPVRVNIRANYGVKKALMGRFGVMDSEELYNTHKAMWNPDTFESARPSSLLGQDFDWMDAVFKTGHTQNYYASVSGSSEKIGYMVSVNHYQEKGTVINTNFARTNVRLNLNAKLASKLDMNLRANYRESDNQSTSSYVTLENAYRALPWDSPYDEDGNILFIDSATRPDNGAPWYGISRFNILHNELYNYNKSSNKGLTADLQFNWQILPWLTATTTNRASRGTYYGRSYTDPRTVSTSNPNGYLSNNVTMSTSYGTTNLLKAFGQWGSHSLNGLLGYEYGKWGNRRVNASGKDMPAGMDVLEVTSSGSQSASGYRTPGASWSFFGQVQYSFADKYFFTGSFRADADSNFAPNHKVGYFPSVTGGWLISNEEFLRDNKVLTFLKLRASFGYTGNSSGISNFAYRDTFSLNADYNGDLAAIPERMPNPNLKWEVARMVSAGLDFNFGNFLEVNLDVYDTRNSDLLLNVPVEPNSGFLNYLTNIGKVQNRGLEIQLNSTNIDKNHFTWTTGFNIGFNKNKVLSLPDGLPIVRSNSASRQIIEEGRDMFTWYMPKWLGVNPENGEPMWWGELKDADDNVIGEGPTNVYADATNQYVGTATPKFTGGFLNRFKYKSVTLSVFANFVYGNKIYHASRASMDGDGAYLDYNMMTHDNNLGWSRWEKPGDKATHPKLVMNGNLSSNNMSSRYLENGSYFRLKNVTLSYDLPKKWMDKIFVNGATVFVSADNLATISRFSGTDPEINLSVSGSNSVAGNYSMNYPVGRVISFGLDVKF